MQGVLNELQTAADSSDVHPQDWPLEKRRSVELGLLRGLQVGVDRNVEILGRSSFHTAATIAPESNADDAARLARFARTLGATDVIYSSKVLGQTQKVVDRAVVTTGTDTFWGSGRDSRGRLRGDDFNTYSSTTWVPTSVPADDTGFVAFFLRDR